MATRMGKLGASAPNAARRGAAHARTITTSSPHSIGSESSWKSDEDSESDRRSTDATPPVADTEIVSGESNPSEVKSVFTNAEKTAC